MELDILHTARPSPNDGRKLVTRVSGDSETTTSSEGETGQSFPEDSERNEEEFAGALAAIENNSLRNKTFRRNTTLSLDIISLQTKVSDTVTKPISQNVEKTDMSAESFSLITKNTAEIVPNVSGDDIAELTDIKIVAEKPNLRGSIIGETPTTKVPTGTLKVDLLASAQALQNTVTASGMAVPPLTEENSVIEVNTPAPLGRATPQPSPIATQIVASITAHGSRETLDIRLDPPELGRVRIEFVIDKADAIKAVLHAERPETLDHLRRHIDDLGDQLSAAGFENAAFDFAAFHHRDAPETEPTGDGMDETQIQKSSDNTTHYLSILDEQSLNILV